jgi:hypothetical protein
MKTCASLAKVLTLMTVNLEREKQIWLVRPPKPNLAPSLFKDWQSFQPLRSLKRSYFSQTLASVPAEVF